MYRKPATVILVIEHKVPRQHIADTIFVQLKFPLHTAQIKLNSPTSKHRTINQNLKVGETEDI